MNELIEKAKSMKLRTKRVQAITKEQAELGVAWLKGDLTLAQVAFALGHKSQQNGHQKVANMLKAAYIMGLIQIKETT